MAMTHTSPEVVELLKLLQEKFGVPETCTRVVVTLSEDDVVRITTDYLPEPPKQ